MQLAAARKDLRKAQQRVDLVPVGVEIVADEHAASAGAWSIGDAFHDAGRVLTVTAGGALVGGAALLPFALLAALGVAHGAAGFAVNAAARWTEPPPASRQRRRGHLGRPGYSSYGSKSALRAPHTGQNQSSGIWSNGVPGGMPPSGSPSSGS